MKLRAKARLAAVAAAVAVAGTVATTARAQWGGTITARTGEAVTVRVSDAYPRDDALPQRWADFLSSLLHGPELRTVTLYLAPPSELRSLCGRGALACYGGRAVIVAPAESSNPAVPAEAIVAHEYGHHVAASRSNAPWVAVDFGTKRWASYLNVCARSRAGELFPGAEDDERYALNPGEGFAEAYRVLNERRLGLVETPWNIVSSILYPDEAALAAVAQDVTAPWTAPSRSSFTTAVSARARSRRYSVATPYDGVLRATVRTTRVRVRVDFVDAGGTTVAGVVVPARTARSVGTTVCGSRSYTIRVSRLAGAGRAQLTISKP